MTPHCLVLQQLFQFMNGSHSSLIGQHKERILGGFIVNDRMNEKGPKMMSNKCKYQSTPSKILWNLIVGDIG